MVLEKVHGLHATSVSLNERFTMLSGVAPDHFAVQRRRRPSFNSYFNQNMSNNNSRIFVQQIARRLEMEVKKHALQQRLGGGLRRFGSETSLPGLRRASSYGNLSQGSVRNRVAWRQSKGNLSRAASFENVSQAWRNFRRRGGGNRVFRGRFRGGVRGRRVGAPLAGARGPVRGQARGPARARAPGGRGRARARGRGNTVRNQTRTQVPSKEELDAQLDSYMSCTRAALDREIDEYMRDAASME